MTSKSYDKSGGKNFSFKAGHLPTSQINYGNIFVYCYQISGIKQSLLKSKINH